MVSSINTSSIGSEPYESKEPFENSDILFRITKPSMGKANYGILMLMYNKGCLNDDNVAAIIKTVKEFSREKSEIIFTILDRGSNRGNALAVFEHIKDFRLYQLSVLEKLNNFNCDFVPYIEHIGSFSDKLCNSVLGLLEELFSNNIVFNASDGTQIGHLVMVETKANLADVLSILQVLSGFSEDQIDRFTLNIKDYFLKTPDILNTPNIFPFNALILAKYPDCKFDFNKLNQMNKFQLQEFLEGVVVANSKDELDVLFNEIMSRASFSFPEEESSGEVPFQVDSVGGLDDVEIDLNSFAFDRSGEEGVEPFSLMDLNNKV